jgi:hypothetical protein
MSPAKYPVRPDVSCSRAFIKNWPKTGRSFRIQRHRGILHWGPSSEPNRLQKKNTTTHWIDTGCGRKITISCLPAAGAAFQWPRLRSHRWSGPRFQCRRTSMWSLPSTLASVLLVDVEHAAAARHSEYPTFYSDFNVSCDILSQFLN